MATSGIEPTLLTRAQCEEIFGYAQHAARRRGVNDVEVMITASSDALTRFANNAIHQNVAERGRFASVRVVVDHRTARVASNRLDRDSIAGNDIQYIASMHLARNKDDNKLVLVQVDPYLTRNGDSWHCFETLTLCPIETRLVEKKLLTPPERAWLNEYHQRVYKTLAPQLETADKSWLKLATAAI